MNVQEARRIIAAWVLSKLSIADLPDGATIQIETKKDGVCWEKAVFSGNVRLLQD